MFSDLPDLLAPGDLIVVNRSRVLPARLLGRRRGGGAAEVFLIRRRGPTTWEALVRPGRRLRSGDPVRVAEDLEVRVESGPLGPGGHRLVRLTSPGDLDAAIESRGHTPLPPYIRRPDRPEDRERYQTIYAREGGSVAAPTAGLHFTFRLLERLTTRGVERAEVVLHVGPGTFQPVTVEEVLDHHVDAEAFVVPSATAEAVARARARGGRIVCVGTTTVRALESAGRDDGTVDAREGETALMIVPGFRFRVTTGLVTNFHLPRSSLLLLVSAFAGRERTLAAYAAAIASGYRFYSYGDAMLIL